MISKLPGWVWRGAWALAFIAGIINTVSLLGFDHQTITHLTGNTTRASEAIATLDFSQVFHFFTLIGAFVIGAIISGFVIKDSTLQLGRRYSAVLILESAMLVLAIPLMKRGHITGMYAAACACGLQNAMVSTYSGAAIRTTHLSGMFTDLGIFIGHLLRGVPINMKRLQLCILVISGFFLGGVVGTWLFKFFDYKALFFPAFLTASVAAFYEIYRTATKARDVS